jgi:hypothetical protein
VRQPQGESSPENELVAEKPRAFFLSQQKWICHGSMRVTRLKAADKAREKQGSME